MSVHKAIEVLAQSEQGWEHAAQVAVAEAAETVSSIKSLNVNNLHAVVEGDRIVQYRINANITFEVASNRPQ